MQTRGLLLGSIALALLAGGVWWSEHAKQKEDAAASSGTKKVITLKADQIDVLELARRDADSVSLRKDKSGWQFTSPAGLRADTNEVSGLVSTVAEVTADSIIEEKATDPGTYGLTQPAVRVTVSAGGKDRRTLLIGDETPTGNSYYASLDGDPRVFTIFGATKSSLDKSAADLRDKRLVLVDERKLSTVELQAGAETIQFGRNAQNEWQIVKPAPMRADNFTVEELVSKLVGLRMDATQTEPPKVTGTRIATARLTDATGTHTIEVFRKADEYFAKGSAIEGVHKVNTEVGEAVAKRLDDFRNKKLFDFGFAEPSRIEVIDGDQTYSFVKGGDKWWSNGKPMDSVGVQSLIDKLRDLRAQSFSTARFPAASSTLVTVVSQNRTEKVQFARSDETVLAVRENEPVVYQIEPKLFEEVRNAAADVKAPPPPAPAKPAK